MTPDNDLPNPISPQEPSEVLHGLDPGELFARALDTIKPSVGGSAWKPPLPEELGRILTNYDIETLLGQGGMGAVYKGMQIILDPLVAIKLLLRRLLLMSHSSPAFTVRRAPSPGSRT